VEAGAAGESFGGVGGSGEGGSAGQFTGGSGGDGGGAGGSLGGAYTGGSAGEDAGGSAGVGGDSTGPIPCTSIVTGAGTLVSDFDLPGSAAGWSAVPNGSSVGGLGDSFVARNVSQGHACPGSLAFTVPFSVYGVAEDANTQVNFAPTRDWTGYTRLHAWVRIPDPGTGSLNHLNAVRLAVLSGNWSIYSSLWAPIAEFADFGWHELVLDLTAAPAADLTVVNQIAVQVFALGTPPEGGPAAPVSTQIYIDDIWLE
jgi:hypothetical protein